MDIVFFVSINILTELYLPGGTSGLLWTMLGVYQIIVQPSLELAGVYSRTGLASYPPAPQLYVDVIGFRAILSRPEPNATLYSFTQNETICKKWILTCYSNTEVLFQSVINWAVGRACMSWVLFLYKFIG